MVVFLPLMGLLFQHVNHMTMKLFTRRIIITIMEDLPSLSLQVVM
jgi:hypothetical protein